MNFYTHRAIAVLVAAASAFLCMLSMLLFPDHLNGWITVGISAGIFVLLYITVSKLLQQFVGRRLAPIYKTIYNLENVRKGLKKQGKENGIVEVNQDVVNWATQKAEEISRLAATEQYRKEFLGNVSHELKTPIFNIQGYILTLLDGVLEDDTINRKYLERAEKSLERLIVIVQDLEYISKLESGEMQLNPANFNIVQLVEELFESFEMNARNHQITLRMEAAQGSKIMVHADRLRISQVLINLISNSINYGKSGGETIVRFSAVPDRVLIEVSDNGIGIEQAKLPRIFERFYRVDKHRSREHGGSGLGLAIVKHNIEAHRQTINVQSEPNVGSTFAFTLNKGK